MRALIWAPKEVLESEGARLDAAQLVSCCICQPDSIAGLGDLKKLELRTVSALYHIPGLAG